MANTLRFKRGLVSGIPTAALGEPLFTTDTFDLYIGNGTGNTRFQKYIASGATTQILRGDGSLYTFPLNISSPSNGQVLKYDGTNWVNSADAGVTGSGANGQVTFWNSASTITGSNNLFWDATNNRLAIAKTNAQAIPTKLYVAGTTGSAIAVSSDFAPGSTASPINLDYTFLGFANNEIARIRSSDVSSNFNAGTLSFWTRESGTLAERARFTFGGNFLLNSTTDNGLRFQVTGDGYFSGSVGIGSTSITGISLRVAKTMTGAVNAVGIYNDGQVQSDVTTAVRMYRSQLNIVNATFTIPDVYHYLAEQGTIGASSTVTNQYGFITGDLSKGTNNYAFYGSLSAGTGKWNIYMAGTANNYMAGSLGIGTTTLTGYTLAVGKNITGSTNAQAIRSVGIIQSDVTSKAYYYTAQSFTANANFALPDLYLYAAFGGTLNNITAGGSITSQYGYFVDASLTGATNNYGFYGNIASGTGRWNLYMNGSASNYVNGELLVGTTTSAGTKLNVSGTAQITGNVFLGVSASSNSILYLFNATNTGRGEIYYDGTNNAFRIESTYGGSGTYRPMTFWTGSTERMRLDASGNLGLGVTPSAWSTSNFRKAIDISFYGSISATNFDITLTGGAYFNGTNYIYRENTFASNYVQTSGQHRWFNAPSGTAGNAITFTQAMTLDASGNLGLGVTPSVWVNTVRAIDFEGGVTLMSLKASPNLYLLSNAYFDTAWKYKANGFANWYEHSAGKHIWHNAPSGTANGAITWTAAMTLFATGNLAVGTTTDAGYRLDVNGTMRVSSANNTTALTVSVGSNASYNFAANSTSGYSATFNINDTALYIGHNSSNRDLRLQTNSTDRLNVKGSGQVRFVPLAAAPTTNVEAGDVYYDSTTNKLRCYNGTTWNDLF